MKTSTAVPAIPNEFPELTNLSEAQLQRLLDDDLAFQTHVEHYAYVEVMLHRRDEIRERNKKKCEDNIARV
jgi:hypothetical protein